MRSIVFFKSGRSRRDAAFPAGGSWGGRSPLHFVSNDQRSSDVFFERQVERGARSPAAA